VLNTCPIYKKKNRFEVDYQRGRGCLRMATRSAIICTRRTGGDQKKTRMRSPELAGGPFDEKSSHRNTFARAGMPQQLGLVPFGTVARRPIFASDRDQIRKFRPPRLTGCIGLCSRTTPQMRERRYQPGEQLCPVPPLNHRATHLICITAKAWNIALREQTDTGRCDGQRFTHKSC